MNKRSFKYGGGGPSKQNLKVDFEKEIMLGYSLAKTYQVLFRGSDVKVFNVND